MFHVHLCDEFRDLGADQGRREDKIAVWVAFGQGCMGGKSLTVEGLSETEATVLRGKREGNSREEGDGEEA